MKTFKWLTPLIVVMMLLVSACSKTVMENQSSTDTDRETEPVTQAEPEPEPVLPAPTPETDNQDLAGRHALVTDHVYFEFDSAVLKPEAQELLRIKARWLSDNPGIAAVIIEGHCDERGTEAYNLALGARRAEAVKHYLSDLGVGMIELGTQSYGEEKPADKAKNEAAWAMNRRAGFVIQ